MRFKLVAAGGTQSLTVSPGRILLAGRSPSCDLPVRDLTVSRRHAEIELSDGGVRVRDLGSTNGTFVDGAPIEEALAAAGSRIAFGKAVFEVRGEQVVPISPELASDAALDATILRQVEVRRTGDLGSRLVPAPSGASRLRIGADSQATRQAAKLALLLDMARELAQQSDLDRLLDKVARLILQVMAVDRVALLTLAADGSLEPRVGRSRVPGEEDGPPGQERSWRVPRAVTRKAVSERVAVLVESAPGEDSTEPGQSGRVESALCAPMIGGQGRVLGVIYLDNLSSSSAFNEEDLEFLGAFSGLVGVAIENGQLIESAQREAVVRSNFQRYFTPELAAQIASQQGEVRLGGVRRRVVVLFSDIRGFTALSEELSPDEIASLLSEYFTEMVDIVFAHGGTLDKFMGDAMMALWGAPVGREDDAERAVAAAIAMQQRLESLNVVWHGEHRPIAIGIGINVGDVFAGNVGSEQRLDYTVIGDAVNVASHLCGQAGPGEILIAETLARDLRRVTGLESLQELLFKGRAQPVRVLRVDWRSTTTT